jgi:hypothetical protein
MTIKNLLKPSILIIIWSLAFVSCAPISIAEQAAPTQDFSDLEIIMTRGMCLGTCPAYTLQIQGNGEGVYNGEYSVSTEGQQTFHVTREQVEELLDAFETAEFYSLEDSYLAPTPEGAFNKVSITYHGKTKTVIYKGGCVTPVPNSTPGEPDLIMNEGGPPQALCELENEIDRIVNSSQWIGERQ